MPEITYETIEANIASVEELDAHQVKVSFKCAASGSPVCEATARLQRDDSTGAKVAASVKRGVAYELRNTAMRMLGSLLGGGAAGRIARQAASTAATDAQRSFTEGAHYTETSRQNAVVAAFKSVESSFQWDSEKSQFVAASG